MFSEAAIAAQNEFFRNLSHGPFGRELESAINASINGDLKSSNKPNTPIATQEETRTPSPLHRAPPLSPPPWNLWVGKVHLHIRARNDCGERSLHRYEAIQPWWSHRLVYRHGWVVGHERAGGGGRRVAWSLGMGTLAGILRSSG